MNLSAKKNILTAYALLSILIILSWIFIGYGPVWHRNVLEMSQQAIPLKWYEYVHDYLGIVLVPAFYGLFAFIPAKKLGEGKDSGFGYMIGALVIGTATSLVAWVGSMFWRIDCNNACMAYIPSYAAIRATLVLAAMLLVGAPAVLVFILRPQRK